MEPISQSNVPVCLEKSTSIARRSTVSIFKVYAYYVQELLIVAVVDYKKRFIDIEAGWPGSVGDARIWANSALNARHKAWLSQFPTTPLATGILPSGDEQFEDIPPFILADSAYANTRNLVTTFKMTECATDPVICALNKKLGGARYHVENAFGILKARFQIFQRPLECATEDIRLAIILICAVLVLHNFLIDMKDELEEDFDLDNRREGQDSQDRQDEDPDYGGGGEDEDMTT